MFGFLNTSILIGLLGVSIPLLIHLLARQRAERVYFSHLMFLQKIQKQHFKRMQFRQILLLLCRCVAILFLVLAFARPVVQGGNLFRHSSRVDAVIALDNSMSMRRGSLWPKALAAAGHILEELDPTDKVTLIDSPQPRQIDRNHAEPMQEIKALPAYNALSIRQMLEMAARELRSSELNRELYLISDLQRSALPDPSDTLQLSGIDHCYLIPLQEDVPNLALTGGGIENQILSPGGPVRCFTWIENFSDQPVENGGIRLLLNGTSVAQKVVNLAPHSRQKIIITALPRTTGWIDGEIRLDEDLFIYDNQWTFSFYIPPQIRLLLLSNEFSDTETLKLALNARHQTTVFDIHQMLPGEPWADQISLYNVIFMVNYPAMSESELASLQQFMTQGGLIVIPGPATDVRSLNRLLGEADIVLGNRLDSVSEESFRSFGEIDYQHPVFDPIFEKGHEILRSPRFFITLNALQTGNSQVLIRFKDGEPFLIVQDKSGRVITMTSVYFSPWSDFQTTAFFAPLMYRLVLFAANRQETGTSQICGSPIEIHYRAQTGQNLQIEATRPDGEELTLLPDISGKTWQYRFTETDLPGHYRFTVNDSLFYLQAMNMNPAESDFSSIVPDSLGSRLGLPVTVIESGAESTSAIEKGRGREFGWELLMIACLLLITEMGLSAWWKTLV
jgi:hypothetical protein